MGVVWSVRDSEALTPPPCPTLPCQAQLSKLDKRSQLAATAAPLLLLGVLLSWSDLLVASFVLLAYLRAGTKQAQVGGQGGRVGAKQAQVGKVGGGGGRQRRRYTLGEAGRNG